MAKSDITGKRKLLGHNVSHSNIKTKRWQHINVQSRRIWVPELNRFVRLDVTTRDIRTIDKIGLLAYAKRHGVKIGLSTPTKPRLPRCRPELLRAASGDQAAAVASRWARPAYAARHVRTCHRGTDDEPRCASSLRRARLLRPCVSHRDR